MTANLNRCEIRETIYRGWKSFEMKTSEVKLIVIPELGGKIVSILYLPTGKEWLVDSGSRGLHKVPYGSKFTDADLSGWDECFPTIVAGEYPFEGIYKGKIVPDHGELWAIPWEVETKEEALVCTVTGRELPFIFTRKMYFLDKNCVRFEYKASNVGDEDLSVFWTAHPLFIGTEFTQICLPKHVMQILCVDGGQSLKSGRNYPWPEGDGSLPRRLDQLVMTIARDSRKFYVNGPVKEGWAGLYERNNGNYLSMVWSPEDLPYLGIWIDEGAYNEQPVCALEPCNGFYDSLGEARKQGKYLLIKSEETSSWHLDISLGCGSQEQM